MCSLFTQPQLYYPVSKPSVEGYFIEKNNIVFFSTTEEKTGFLKYLNRGLEWKFIFYEFVVEWLLEEANFNIGPLVVVVSIGGE